MKLLLPNVAGMPRQIARLWFGSQHQADLKAAIAVQNYAWPLQLAFSQPLICNGGAVKLPSPNLTDMIRLNARLGFNKGANEMHVRGWILLNHGIMHCILLCGVRCTYSWLAHQDKHHKSSAAAAHHLHGHVFTAAS